jgi:CheY-like chemotaxis protein
MPGRGGGELADLLTASHRNLLVLYTSGYTDDAVIQRGVSGAGSSFLPKPFTPHTLALKVRELLDRATGDAA